MNNELHELVTFEDLDPFISKSVAEDNKRNNRSLKEYIRWRIRDWEDFCRELSGSNINNLEDMLSDPEYIRSCSNMFTTISALEMRKFIKKRISELKALEKVTPYEETWEWRGTVDFYGHILTTR